MLHKIKPEMGYYLTAVVTNVTLYISSQCIELENNKLFDFHFSLLLGIWTKYESAIFIYIYVSVLPNPTHHEVSWQKTVK